MVKHAVTSLQCTMYMINGHTPCAIGQSLITWKVVLIAAFNMQDKYKVYNLCSERLYDASLFEGKVSCDSLLWHNYLGFRNWQLYLLWLSIL